MKIAHALAALLAWISVAEARVVLEQGSVPVKVVNIYGREIERDVQVWIYYESTAPRPYPLLVLNHGRSGKAALRAALNPKDYEAAARWLTRFGFMVAVPVRVGYGATGGNDVEDTGNCHTKSYPPAYHAAAVQTLAVIEMLRKRPDADQERALVMGQSFGGATAIGVAALMPAGVQGTINVAGGGGGDPEGRPQNPCSPHGLLGLFAGYGKTARIPTLWLYSENDQYWGPKLPREWFDAFLAAGGKGEFTGFPPVSDDGHRMFSRAPQLWQPRVQEFLLSLGYKPL